MGCQISVSKATTFENAFSMHSTPVDRESRTKVIVLGTSNCGKSTLLRQFQLINTEGFNQKERQSFIPLITSNIETSLEFVLDKIPATSTLYDDPRTKETAEDFLKQCGHINFREVNTRLLELAADLWKKSEIREKFHEVKEEFENGDSLVCLLESLHRISAPDYLPTNQDILYCRMRTTGIKTLNFIFDDIPLQIIDVGGQRSERRKWIHYFDNVEVIIFCVSLNEYNLPLREDPTKNAMEESLEMFNSIINSTWFKTKPIILFLNKMDLLETKIKHSSIGDYYPDFSGNSKSFEDVSSFIKNKYLLCDRQKGRQIYSFNTCATDTRNIQKVSQICFHMVFRKTLSAMGL